MTVLIFLILVLVRILVVIRIAAHLPNSNSHRPFFSPSRWANILPEGHIRICPLVNQQKTMENHHFKWVYQLLLC
jgi:hypothetical protein